MVTRLTSRNGFSNSASAPSVCASVHSAESCVQCAVIIVTMTSGADSRIDLQQRDAVEPRHADVGQHHVDIFAGDQVAGRDAVLGGQHLEAVALKQQPHPLAHRLLVVGDQDARLLGRRLIDLAPALLSS